MYKRIIVTGSRDWTNKLMVIGALNDMYTYHGKYMLVHGACPTGADKIADDWYETYGEHYTVGIDRFYPAWDIWGDAAGPKRNSRMVRSGGDMVLSFPLGISTGTWDCINKAVAAEIPVRVYDYKSGRFEIR